MELCPVSRPAGDPTLAPVTPAPTTPTLDTPGPVMDGETRTITACGV